MQFSNQVIARTVDYIEAHLADKLTLDKIAVYAGYSKFHLNRLFAEETGCTIHRYIQNRRLTEAARRLVETDDTILEVSFEAGYETQQSFTLAFQRLYHVPPRLYRSRRSFIPAQPRWNARDMLLLLCMGTAGRAAA